MPRPVKQFFEAIPQQGFPAPKAKPQSQPWKAIWGGIEGGIEQPFGEGKLIVACPKIATYGMWFSIEYHFQAWLEADADLDV